MQRGLTAAAHIIMLHAKARLVSNIGYTGCSLRHGCLARMTNLSLHPLRHGPTNPPPRGSYCFMTPVFLAADSAPVAT